MRSKAGSKRANIPFMRTGCRHILPATSPPPSLRKPPVVFRFAWRGPAQKEVDKGLWGRNAQKKRKEAMNKRRNAPCAERDEGEPWDWVRFLILELRLSGGRYWKGCEVFFGKILTRRFYLCKLHNGFLLVSTEYQRNLKCAVYPS